MKYFTIKELCKSDTADAYKIDNSPTEEDKMRLVELIEELLDPLREAWGSPIKVTSGYRSKNLNRVIKNSSPTSAHCIGYAADLQPCNKKMAEFKIFVRKWLSDKAFDQYIDEYSDKSEWVHLGYKNRSGKQRRQYLQYKNNKFTTIKP